MDLGSTLKVILRRCPRDVDFGETFTSSWLIASNFSGNLEVAITSRPNRHEDYLGICHPETILEDIVSTCFSRPSFVRVKAITITTVVDERRDPHLWCFAGPMETVRTPASYPDIHFKSACDCGAGKNTRCGSIYLGV